MYHRVIQRVAQDVPSNPRKTGANEEETVMDERIETIAKNGTELVADFVDKVVASSARFVENLLENVTTLTRGVVADGSKVVTSACEPFLKAK